MYNTCRDLSCCFRLQILSDIILAGASKTSCGVQNPNKTANPLTLLMEPLDIHFIKPATFHKQIEMTLRRWLFHSQKSGGGRKPIYMNKCLLHKQFMLTLLTDCWLHTQSESNLVESLAKQQFLTHFLQLTGGEKSILRHLWHAGDACLVFPFVLLFPHFCLHFWLVSSSARASTPTGLWLTGRICCCPSHNERRQRWEQLNRRDNRSLIQTLMQNLYLLHRQKTDCQASHFQTFPCKLRKGQTRSGLQTAASNFVNLGWHLYFHSHFSLVSSSQFSVHVLNVLYIYTETKWLRNKARFQNIKLSKWHFSNPR